MASRLYGESVAEEEAAASHLGPVNPIDPNKKKTNLPGFASQKKKPEPKKLTTLQEEYEKAAKDFDTDYVNKRVPRVPGQSNGHGN